MRRPALLITCVLFAAGTAACGDDKDDTADESTSSTTSSTTSTTSAEGSADAEKEAEVVRFDREVQAELIAVGCYEGAEDGIIGPETDAAIKEFQSAEGLEVDGEVGTETSAALTRAASDGRKVCGATPSSTTTTTTAKSTTTAAGGGSAACTATALMEGLPAEGETIGHYVCSDGWAGGTLTDGTPFILESQGGRWYAPSQDPCGSASAGISPEVLEAGCPKS